MKLTHSLLLVRLLHDLIGAPWHSQERLQGVVVGLGEVCLLGAIEP